MVGSKLASIGLFGGEAAYGADVILRSLLMLIATRQENMPFREPLKFWVPHDFLF